MKLERLSYFLDRCAWTFLFAFSFFNATAETLELRPVADTTLFEARPNNNLGRENDFAVGTTSGGLRSRAVLRFDVSGLPAGARISSVTLQIQVTKTPLSGGESSNFQLRRLLRSWGEGTKTGNTGAPAGTGEATWLARMAPGQLWTQPGAGLDFSNTVSGVTAVSGVGPYTFQSTAELVGDLESWMATPTENHGWIMMSDLESLSETARRVASREDVARAPLLRIEYELPPAELRITNVQLHAQEIELSWTGGVAPFQVQEASALEGASSNWRPAAPVTSTNLIRLARTSENRFFRLVGDAAAIYSLEFVSDWSSQTHPVNFPPGPHWSGLVGAVHNSNVVFWAEGALASKGIQDVAELGSKVALLNEVGAALSAGTAFSQLSGNGINPSPGSVIATFELVRSHPLVTVVSMIAPSPDWFVGVAGLSLIENGQWAQEKQITLHLYDAGTDSGTNYTSPDQVTSPHVPIQMITGFPAEQNGSHTTFGTFTFRKLP